MPFPSIFGPTSTDDIVGHPVDDILNRKSGQNIGQSGISFKKSSFEYVDQPGTVLSFQFNPGELKQKMKANWAIKKPIQSEQPIFQHLNFDGRTVSFELFFHGLEPRNGRSFSTNAPAASGVVGALLKRAEEGLIAFASKQVPFAEGIGSAAGIILNKAFPKSSKQQAVETRPLLDDFDFLRKCLHGQGNKPPPRLHFNWAGYDDSEWILEDLEITETMWDVQLLPLMAKAHVVLHEVKPPKFGSKTYAVSA